MDSSRKSRPEETSERHRQLWLEIKERLEALGHQRDTIRLDLDTAGVRSEPLPADLALIQSLGLLDQSTSLARVAERLTTTANRVLTAQGSGPVSMGTTYKYLPTTTANDHLDARLSILAGETGTRAKTPKSENWNQSKNSEK